MIQWVLAIIIVLCVIGLIYYYRKPLAGSHFKGNAVNLMKRPHITVKKVDSYQLIDELVNKGWHVKVTAAGPGYRESKEQARILYGDRVFNAMFYQMYPLFTIDENITLPIWYNDSQSIEGVLSHEELEILVGIDLVNLRGLLYEKGWRFHFSKMCKKCIIQRNILYDNDEQDLLMEQEYIENHKHLWTNGDKSIEKVMNILELYALTK